jgi:hypothetical protein
MKLESCFSRFVSPMVLAGVLSFSAAGSAQKAVPDAQIEAGVLKALASAPELATQGINTTTVYGTVTLSGSVQTEAQRQKAEQLAANAPNVKKVVDELTLGGSTAPVSTAQNQQDPGDGRVLLSDGTYAPADNSQQPNAQQNPQMGQATPGQPGDDNVPPPNGPDTDPYGRPLNQQGNGQQANGQQNTAQEPPNTTPQPGYGYPNGQPQYPPQTQAAGQYPPPARAPYNGPYGAPPPQQNGYNQQAPGYGQVGGQTVTIPSGTVLQVRVNQHLSSRDIKAGTPFQAIIVHDIVAGGQIAIPRGASVQGVVVDATSSGTLKGRGELGLQLNQISLGGQTFPITSDIFTAHGGDKTLQTVNSTVGLGALGAIFGAVAGGGAGAAIGAGVGGAVGLGASAASGRGDVFIPSEAVLNFRIVQPASVVTVSQAELQRLGYGVPAGGPLMVRRYPPPGYYYPAPVYYYPRGYYRPYYPY